MNPFQLNQQLNQLITSGTKVPAMIWGAPGIGKSSIVAELAQAHKFRFIDLRISQLAPTDLRGLPVPENGKSTWYPPEFLPDSGEGILFLDEINMSPPAVQAIAQQLVLDRRVGNYQVPEGWHIWAAGNRKEDKASVFDMPAPLANRFIHFEVAAEFESFRSWAVQAGIHEQILAFLAFRPALLHKMDNHSAAWPSPRSWAMADKLHKVKLPIESAVSEAVATEFQAFISVYDKLPNLDQIIKGKGTHVFPKDPSARFATTVGLSVRAKERNGIRAAFSWLLESGGAEWCQLFINNVKDAAQANNQLGELAILIREEPKMQKFLKGFKLLLRKGRPTGQTAVEVTPYEPSPTAKAA